jgi:CRP-like cAMP-binding protein
VSHFPLSLLVRKIETITSLSENERQAILDLPIRIADLRADADILGEGDRPSQCSLLVDGFVCRYKGLPDGRRQILAFYIAGDILDLLSLQVEVMDHSLATTIPSRVAYIPHDALRKVVDEHPAIGGAFWRDTLIDAAVFREWIVNVGAREAYSRIAHLICEMFTKSEAVGLVNGTTFKFPVTQSEIGEATGLSTVHVNRTLMELRRDGLIVFEKGRCTITDLARLKEAATFDPAYLHLQPPERSAA